jgi:hypothetical protein
MVLHIDCIQCSILLYWYLLPVTSTGNNHTTIDRSLYLEPEVYRQRMRRLYYDIVPISTSFVSIIKYFKRDAGQRYTSAWLQHHHAWLI